ncbi:MAG: hypothetical protein IT366_10040 [Candidatus Hydrogenedentes bacterium]|nr:hypothetical protein [Candidatus Hydrogenedentota bacterium]
MNRRRFLTLSAGAAATAPLSATPISTAAATETAQSASLLRNYSEEDHRLRLLNIAACTRSIRSCLRKHLITDYLPGQCCYNLGEYPARKPWTVDEYDEQELDRLQAHGIQILQVFDDWNDSLRLFGGDKYSAVNPEGYRRFIEMAHRRGMKVLTYTSPCFLQRSDPDFKQAWSREGDFLVVGYWDMARCAPASPGWRAFVLRKYAQVLDEYGADGIYIDGGYLANKHAPKQAMPLAKDEIAAFEETPQYDGAFADLLALIYADVKRRGGIVKLHVNAAEKPEAGGLKTYDYLWVGEGVTNADALREAVKNYDPYVVPCLDMGFTSVENEDEPYLHAIPYMQFPVTMGGRIFTGERGTIEGVKYNDDFWMQRCRDAWKQYQSDPSKLHTYSAWDAVPGNPNTRPTHARWLKQYLPMVEEGTWAYLEVGDSTLFAAPRPKDVVVSVFANRALHIVLANFGRSPAEIRTAESYVATNVADANASTHWTIPPRSLLILRRIAQAGNA